MQTELITGEPVAADLSHVHRDTRDEPQRRPDAYALIERAVEKGLDPAQLKALVDLHEQMRATSAKEAFNAAMRDCQEELPLIVKDAKNEQTGSLYAKMDHIQGIAKPIFTKHGFALSFAEADSPIAGFKRTICDVRHCEGHTERYHLDLPLDGFSAKGNPIGSMNPVQAAISTGTYAQRYLICRIFNITVSDTDLDGRPAARPNTGKNSSAPSAEPRGQRRPKPQAPQYVTAEQVAFLVAEWKHLYQGEFAAWEQFVQAKTGRVFDVKKASNWTHFDYETIRKALNIPTDEELANAKP